MKILLINKFLYPKGGDAISTINTGKLLASKGHDVIFWGMDHPSNPDYPHKDLFVSHVDFTGRQSPALRIKTALKILYSFEAKRKIEALIQKEKPDLVHLNNFAHQITPSILPVFRKYRIPSVMTMRDYKLVCPSYAMLSEGKPCEKCRNGRYFACFLNRCTKNSRLKSLLNTMEMYLHHDLLKLYDLIDVYVAPSRFMQSKLVEMGFKKNVLHLPNFVNLSEYEPAAGWTENSIVYFGRFSEEKGLPTLIQSVKDLDIRLKLIGEGPLQETLMAQVRRLGLTNVEFCGYKTHQDLQNEIKSAKAIVLPSECYENNPRTVIEAFALGKPVIGARIGGIPELVRDGQTGLTFESGNADDLRDKIRQLISSNGQLLDLGRKARAFVEQNFNPEQHYEKLMQIYHTARTG